MARTWTASQEAAMSLSGKTLLVSAAAGSGKTSVLTERIIRRLTDREAPADLSRILVVTFTRAAAAELKSRIASALSDALAENPGDRHLSRQLLSLGSAQISTIDSFFQRIIRANFERLGLPATFRIADDSEILPLCIEILDGLIEEFYQKHSNASADTSPLSRMENNAFAEAMDHLMSNRSDGKLNLLLLDYLDHFAALPQGIEYLKECANELREAADCELMQTRYGKRLADNLKELFEAYSAELSRLKNAIAADPDAAKKCAGLLSNDQSYCNAVLTAIDKNSYTALQAAAFSFIPGRFPTIKDKPAAVSAYQELRAVFRKDISAKVQGKLEWPPALLPPQLRKTADLCDMLYCFYKEFEARLNAEKHTRGILEHNDVRSMLYRLLSESDGSASELAKSLSSQYDAVYIDEYQDVDLLQDRIFSLIGENRRFMVGDIKQSIYGFRGSDPSIFADYRRKMPLHTECRDGNDANGVCVFMSENFRCDSSVIDFANCICSFLFSACEESVGYRPQDDLVCSKFAAEGQAPAPVQVAVFEAPARGSDLESRAEAVWAAGEISRLLREERKNDGSPILPSDIAILVRAKAQGTDYARELEALGIPVLSDTSSDFLHEPILTDVLNLLRVIDNPYRDLPLSEFCLSPIGGFTLEELTEIRAGAPDTKALYDSFCAIAESRETALGEKAGDLLDWLENLRTQAAILPADRFLRLLYLEEPIASFSREPVLLFLYEEARIYQRTSWCGLYGFLKHVDKLFEGKKINAGGFCKAESAVTIMTVHHSKGLEFPVVFLASCGSYFNKSDIRESLLFHKTVGCASKLYDRQSGERENTLLCELVKDEIDAEETEESIRTLYVALTRARERLYVTGTLRGTMEKTLANLSTVKRGNRAGILSCNSYLSWILAVKKNMQEENLEFPCNFHYILQDEVMRGLPILSDERATAAEETAPATANPLSHHYAEVSRKSRDFNYPLSALRDLPTKAAASKLQPDLVDVLMQKEDSNEALIAQINLMASAGTGFDALLADHTKPSPTDIGTATHTFLQFCSFDALAKDGVDIECARLLSQKFMPQSMIDIIHKTQLEVFRESQLMKEILQAKKVYREQKFGLFMPFSELTRSSELASVLAPHNLFVQGSIDLLLEADDGALTLVDYKTDHITDAEKKNPALLSERMKKAHGTQLACYARAIKALFGRAPDRILIYSLPLGASVEI